MNLFRWMEISWLFGANFALCLIHTRTYSRTQTHIPCQFFVCNTRLNTTDATPATTKINVRSYGNWTIIRRILLFYRCFQKKGLNKSKSLGQQTKWFIDPPQLQSQAWAESPIITMDILFMQHIRNKMHISRIFIQFFMWNFIQKYPEKKVTREIHWEQFSLKYCMKNS